MYHENLFALTANSVSCPSNATNIHLRDKKVPCRELWAAPPFAISRLLKRLLPIQTKPAITQPLTTTEQENTTEKSFFHYTFNLHRGYIMSCSQGLAVNKNPDEKENIGKKQATLGSTGLVEAHRPFCASVWLSKHNISPAQRAL